MAWVIPTHERSRAPSETDLLLKWIMMSSEDGTVRGTAVCVCVRVFDRDRFLVLRVGSLWLLKKV